MGDTPRQDDLLGEKGIYKGRDFSRTYDAKDDAGNVIPLTGFVIEAQIRTALERDAEEIAAFNVEISEAEGEFTISLTDTVTNAIEQTEGFFDIMVQDAGGLRLPWVYGKVDIQETVTVKT
jgi:hypothetical protein